MDQEKKQSLSKGEPEVPGRPETRRGVTRRQALKQGLAGAAALGAAGAFFRYLTRPAAAAGITTEVFRNDAPPEELWQLWRKRGWIKEAYHYLRLGRNVQCRVCPNHCILSEWRPKPLPQQG